MAAVFIWRLEYSRWVGFHHSDVKYFFRASSDFFPTQKGYYEAMLHEPGPVGDPFVVVTMESRRQLFTWVAAHFLMPISHRTNFLEVERYVANVIRYERQPLGAREPEILRGDLEEATTEMFESHRQHLHVFYPDHC